jgi:hypothetical protein
VPLSAHGDGHWVRRRNAERTRVARVNAETEWTRRSIGLEEIMRRRAITLAVTSLFALMSA